VPPDCWSWRSGVVAPFRGTVDGAAVLFGAEEAQARGTRLTLVAEGVGARHAGEQGELVRAAFPGLEVAVVQAAAAAPVLNGLARSAALVVVGAESPQEPRLSAVLATASEAPVAVIRSPRLRRLPAAPGRPERWAP
jgi:hypothetical protein